MENITQTEIKTFEELEKEKLEKELKEATKRVEELSKRLAWIEENIVIGKALRLALPKHGIEFEKLEVHNSEEFNIRIEMVLKSFSISDWELEVVRSIVKEHGYSEIKKWQIYYDLGKTYVKIWF